MNHENQANLIEKIAYVEMYVGNIFQAKNFFATAMKLEHVATTKTEETITCLMKQEDVNILLTSSLNKDSVVAKHLAEYGDSVKKIAFWVNDVERCVNNTVNKGAKIVDEPQNRDGVLTASIEVFNYVEHVFLELDSNKKIPGFDYDTSRISNQPIVFNIDHIALCHPRNTIKNWVEFYQECFGFTENKNEDIYAEESGMHIIIMQSPNGRVNLPLVEPSSEHSRLNGYLNYNHGSGIHHIAFETNDIIQAVQHYERNHGELRKALPKYFEDVKSIYPDQIENIEKLAPHGIMLEQDDKGILFQIFTKPIVTRPTLFLEFIQRDVCEGFGTVNIKALYDTLEIEKMSNAS
jgi:4-hydroxyphenylpyruvate dioxygenase